MRAMTGVLLFLATHTLLGCGEDSSGPSADESSLTHRWSKRFGDADNQNLNDVAVDAAGNVAITGECGGSADFGGGVLSSGGGPDIFMAVFDAEGTHLWSKLFGDADIQLGDAIAFDAAGGVVLGVLLRGTADFGGGALTSAGLYDVCVATFDASGAHRWSKRFGDLESQTVNDVAVDVDGNVFIAGGFSGSIDFGGGALTSAGNSDAYVAAFDSDGEHLWSKRFGDAANSQSSVALAVDRAGYVVVAGRLAGNADFGGGLLTGAGFTDIFVASFESDGTHRWSKNFGDTSAQIVHGIAIDGAGNVALAGYFSGSVDFGGGALTGVGGRDIFLASFSAAGDHRWSQRFGDGGDQSAYALSADDAGNVALAGTLDLTVNFGGRLLTSAGGSDVVAAGFGPDGSHLWSRRFGDIENQAGRAIALDAQGRAVLAGDFTGEVDFGGGELMSAGDSDLYLASFGQ